MEDSHYVGHTTQLQSLAQELNPGTRTDASTGRLFHICGPDGAGKRSFVERLWELLKGGEVPRIFFTIKASDEVGLPTAFMEGAKANREHLVNALREVAEGVRAQATRLEQAGRALPPEAMITVWSDLFEQVILGNPRNNRNLQIVFALPDFLNLPASLRHIIAREIPQGSETVECHVLVLSNRKNGSELTQIFPDRAAPEEVPLPALTIDEVEEWTKLTKFPTEFATDLYQRCGGLPGRLQPAADQIIQEHKDHALLLKAEVILSQLDASQHENACMAAALPEINLELLQILLPEEQAGQALQNLRACNIEGSLWRNRTLILSPDARVALTKYLQQHFPQAYRKVQPIAEQFASIHQTIPLPEHRELLCRLSVFNFFNEEIVKEIYGDLWEDVSVLTSAAPEYFDNTGNNVRLKAPIREIIEAYMRLVKYPQPEAEKKRIATAWEACRRKILNASATSEEKITRESESLSQVQNQIKRLGSEIDKESERLSRVRRRAQRRSEKPQKTKAPKSPVWQLTLQAIGFVILYFGLLFSPRAAFLYVVIGLGMMIGGLFVKGGMLAGASVRTEPQAQIAPPGDMEQHERNLHFLQLKRGQLQTKQNTIASNIAKERSSLKEFEKLLREPYS